MACGEVVGGNASAGSVRSTRLQCAEECGVEQSRAERAREGVGGGRAPREARQHTGVVAWWGNR